MSAEAYTTPVANDGTTSTAAAVDANHKGAARGAFTYGVGTSGTDAYASANSVPVTSLYDGLELSFKADVKNTGPATYSPDGLTAHPIVKNYNQPLKTGDILAGQIVKVKYDLTNTNWQMVSPPATVLQRALSWMLGFYMNSTGGGAITYTAKVGYSSGTTKTFAVAMCADATNDYHASHGYQVAEDFGNSLATYSHTDNTAITAGAGIGGVVMIGTDMFVSGSGTEIRKNGSVLTISGTARYGALGHNQTSSYLLVLYSTTKVAQFSGISGTTITNVSDITLDTAVTAGMGFIYDDANAQYYFLDTTAHLIRKFDSAGVTLSTTSYTFTDAKAAGLMVLDGRVYVVMAATVSSSTAGAAFVTIDLVPTTIIIA